jgi:hypothetical protein
MAQEPAETVGLLHLSDGRIVHVLVCTTCGALVDEDHRGDHEAFHVIYT